MRSLYKLYRKVRGHWVILYDYDGEANLRRAYQIGDTLMADRMRFGVSIAVLNQDGTTSGPRYVKRWVKA